MSDEYDWHRYTQNPSDAAPAAETAGSSHHRGTSVRTSAKQFLAGWRTHSLFAFLVRHLVLILFALLILFPLGGIVLGYMARPRSGSTEQADAGLIANTPDNSDKIKPAPGKPFLAKTETPPPVVMHQPPAAALDQQSPPAFSVPARPVSPAPVLPNSAPSVANPPAPGVAGNQPYTPVVYSARHDKVFGEGCAGQLTLDTTGLAFRCPDDPGSSVQVALGDIEAIDGNGVRLTSGKKYHFSIAGMGKSNAQQLFANWLSRVR